MKKANGQVIFYLMILLLVLVINAFFFSFFKSSISLIYIGFWVIAGIIAYFMFGYKKETNMNKTDIYQIAFIYALIYFLVIYLAGLVTGFFKSPYSMNILSIIKNVWPIITVIIAQELIRYCIVKNTKHKLSLIALVLIYVGYTVVMNIGSYNLHDGMEIFEFVGVVLLPSIVNNAMITYASSKVGMGPGIMYRLLLELYTFVIPIIPDLGPYFWSVFNLVLPTIILVRCNTIFAKKKKHALPNKVLDKLILIIILSLLALIVILVSGHFKYVSIAIGSNSMQPVWSKGAVVIYKKVDEKNENELHEGDILVYQHGKITIVHRIIEIQEKKNAYIYHTKGDNNEDADGTDILIGDVKGKVVAFVPYIGYPSVWLSELMNK